jgi:hypothetical protein
MKNCITTVFFLLITTILFAQQEATDSSIVKQKDSPVSSVFESGILIDAQTTVIPDVKTLEFVIQHKFGSVENGHSDLWGIYAPGSNIRLGLNFVIRKNIQVGAGITKNRMMTDLSAKWTIFQQTQKNTIPVSVTVYGNIGIDGRNISAFESGKVRVAYTGPVNSFAFSDRLSYFSELIVSRKFTKWFSLQGGVSFTHYNSVEELYDHDKIGIHFNGRMKVSNQGSVVFNYDQPLKIKNISEQRVWTNPPKPNLALGYEISTFTHVFHIYIASTNSILPQENIMWNQNDWKNKGLAIGFTITRLWMF